MDPALQLQPARKSPPPVAVPSEAPREKAGRNGRKERRLKITIRIDCSGDAFKPEAEPEVARILTEYTYTLGRVHGDRANEFTLFDINGNKAGVVRWTR